MTLFLAVAITLIWPGIATARIDDCLRIAAAEETRQGIPSGLLQAIALTESGRWQPDRAGDSAVSAWPWTVTNGADGQYFPSRAAAMSHVLKLQAAGETNIDVGCMQINLAFHPDAFDNLNEAFTPEVNIAYAAGFLMALKSEGRSWHEAARHYHSKTPHLAARYGAKLARNLAEIKRRTAADRRADETPPSITAEAAPQRTEPRSVRTARNFAETWRQERLRAWHQRNEVPSTAAAMPP